LNPLEKSSLKGFQAAFVFSGCRRFGVQGSLKSRV